MRYKYGVAREDVLPHQGGTKALYAKEKRAMSYKAIGVRVRLGKKVAAIGAFKFSTSSFVLSNRREDVCTYGQGFLRIPGRS